MKPRLLVIENTLLAFEALADRKFRSFLTVMGVFIGVVIIIGVASVLNGFRQRVIDSFEQFGTSISSSRLDVSLHQDELLSKHLDVDDERMGAVFGGGDRLVPERDLLRGFLGDGLDARSRMPRSQRVTGADATEGWRLSLPGRSNIERRDRGALRGIRGGDTEALSPSGLLVGVVAGVEDPHHVSALGGPFERDDRQSVGVRRVSTGSLLASAAYGALVAGADELLHDGTSQYGERGISRETLADALSSS
jgi:hypothetical protein